MKKAYLAKRG